MALMLPPAENAAPSPVMISTETSAQAFAHSSVAQISSIRLVPESALRMSSRLKVSTATRPSSSSAASFSAGRPGTMILILNMT